VQETTSSSDVVHLSNPCTVGKKFFWPNMTNGEELYLSGHLERPDP
jgi:hypothetical protein